MTSSPRPLVAQLDPHGFTILELLAAMAMLAVMSSIVATKIDVDAIRVTGGVRVIRSVLQQGQRAAVEKHHDVIVSFDLHDNRLRVAEDSNSNHVVDTYERSTWHPLEQGVHFAAPSTGVGGTATSAMGGAAVRLVGGYPSITFHGDGAASSNLELYVTSARARRTDARAITLAKSTGRTGWYRYTGFAWAPGGP